MTQTQNLKLFLWKEQFICGLSVSLKTVLALWTHWGCYCGGRCSGCAAGREPECEGSHVDSAEPVPSAHLQNQQQSLQFDST